MKAKLSFFSERSHIMTEELTFLNLKLTFLKISKNMTNCKKNTNLKIFSPNQKNKNVRLL